MKILVCDTSNSTCCAGVYEDGREIAYKLSFEKRPHSETFMPLVHEVMSEANVTHADLDAYATTVGPGSFTGIRIGAAAVKGMAQAGNKKCVPVSSLEAIAFPYRDSENIVCAVMDARCSQVYCAAFRKGERLFEDKAILIEDFIQFSKSITKRPYLSATAQSWFLILLRTDSIAKEQNPKANFSTLRPLRL